MPATTVRFRSRIEIDKINPYVFVSADRAARLKKNWRKPMPVRIQVNGKPDTPWRINLMPVGGGNFYKSGPAHPMPSWFGDELVLNPRAKKGWDILTPSRQKEILRYFAGLKSPQAQRRNVQKALYVLAGGKARFMARDWNARGDK